MRLHIVTGMIQLNEVRYWRISYLWKTAALIPVDDEAASRRMAFEVCDALNKLQIRDLKREAQ